MELQTISKVSKVFSVSTRTLRYYEKIGLLKSVRTEEYAYRMYDSEAIKRLSQIILLRKLRMPLKQIQEVLNGEDAGSIVKIFDSMLMELDAEINSLNTIRTVVERFVKRLGEKGLLKGDMLEEENLADVIDSLSHLEYSFKEALSMQDITKADEKLSKLKNVRIVYLPPATVAAAQYEGEDPEDYVGKQINDFVYAVKLWEIKPDFRQFGFNNPQPVDASNYHGYEMWVTIPEDMEVPKPLEKKHFAGGTYAAHCIKMGDFHEWAWLDEWVQTNGKYVYGGNTREARFMFGSLEESLNYVNIVQKGGEHDQREVQLDLLIPVVEK